MAWAPPSLPMIATLRLSGSNAATGLWMIKFVDMTLVMKLSVVSMKRTTPKMKRCGPLTMLAGTLPALNRVAALTYGM